MMEKVKQFNNFLKDCLFNKTTFSEEKSKIRCTIIILLSILYIVVFLIPQVRAFSRKWSEDTKIKADITNVQKDWTNISLFKKEISQLNEKITSYEKMLPGEKEMPAVLAYLSDAAKKMDIRIDEIKPIEEENKKGAGSPSFYNEAPIMLKAECGYHQFGRFLNDLENAARFMKISNLKIVANPARPNVHYVQLTVVTYMTRK